VRNQSPGAALMSRLGTPNLRGIDDAIDLQHRQGAIGLVRILRRREGGRNLRIKRSGPRSRCGCGCARCSRRQSDSDQRSGRSGIVTSVARAGPRSRKQRDHENRKTPISKPPANAQRPNVQAETTRTRIRRSCGIISWDRSVIAAAPPSQQLQTPSFTDGRHPGDPATHPD
jgi:hypothetical protein